MNAKYIEALEALEVLRNCHPSRCDLSASERAAKKAGKVDVVLAFVSVKTKSAQWQEKQDQVLNALTSVV